jgi:alpha-L-fucosidase 2
MTPDPSRRGVLALTAALAALPTFTATAAPQRPADAPAPDADPRHRLRWQAPADEHSMIEQGLPVGNRRLGALASNDPGRELLAFRSTRIWVPLRR